jgi:hypothetical protein
MLKKFVLVSTMFLCVNSGAYSVAPVEVAADDSELTAEQLIELTAVVAKAKEAGFSDAETTEVVAETLAGFGIKSEKTTGIIIGAAVAGGTVVFSVLAYYLYKYLTKDKDEKGAAYKASYELIKPYLDDAKIKNTDAVAAVAAKPAVPAVPAHDGFAEVPAVEAVPAVAAVPAKITGVSDVDGYKAFLKPFEK